MTLDFHPLASMFPLMEGDDYTALVEDIAQHGQREAIWLYDGMILDGRNRYRACVELGLVPDTQTYTGDDPRAFVVSLNLHRRHLTREQRNELIRDLRANGMTLQKIADAVGASVGSVHKAVEDFQLFKIEKLKISGGDGKEYPTSYADKEVHEQRTELIRDLRAKGMTLLDVADAVGVSVGSVHKAVSDATPERRKPHVAQNNGENEWYTPAQYIEAARVVMGSIDLDPASSDVANTVVQASAYYTAHDDGLGKPWRGNIWLNPPYAQPLIAQFSAKLQEEWAAGNIHSAIVLVNNATETAWFHGAVNCASAVCFPLARVKFWAPDRSTASPLQGQAILYLGDDADIFVEQFRRFGWCGSVLR